MDTSDIRVLLLWNHDGLLRIPLLDPQVQFQAMLGQLRDHQDQPGPGDTW